MPIRLIVGADDAGRRLDRLLRKCLGDLPLSAIHRLLRTGRVRVDGRKALAADRIAAGSVLELPDVEGTIGGEGGRSQPQKPEGERDKVQATGEPLAIVWEGSGLLVVSKPAGLLVHGPRSLEDRVRAYLEGKLAPSLSFRPGPLHRLDQGTSGLVAFSTSLAGAQRFSEALRERRLRKRYIALLEGELLSLEDWEDDLIRDRDRRTVRTSDQGSRAADGGREEKGAKNARTRVFPLARGRGRTLALVEIGTGRTHQIRAQASAHAHPLAGDRKYGGAELQGGFLLHAYELATPQDAGLALPPILVSPPPERFLKTVERLFDPALAEKLRTALPTDAILDAIM